MGLHYTLTRMTTEKNQKQQIHYPLRDTICLFFQEIVRRFVPEMWITGIRDPAGSFR